MKCVKHIAMLILLSASVACSTLPPRHPVPIDHQGDAKLLGGIPALRAWAGTFSNEFEEDLVKSVDQRKHFYLQSGSPDSSDINILMLSGGGQNGAFGAGFMDGWSQSGLRPEFKVVTGISTGAIIAPFAFLGPDYDEKLKQAFTTVGAKDIFIIRWLSFLWTDSLTDTTPLLKMIEKYIDQDMLSAVARAHNQGRRLYIGTTNLDADRLVIWNMGVIANSGHPGALELFRKVILASSSIPVVFQPVLINVNVADSSYDELHVDGGLKTQVFFTAATVDLEKIRNELEPRDSSTSKIRLYLIRNATLGLEPEQVPQKLTEISQRAMASLIKSQARNDLIRINYFAKKLGYDFNWVTLPAEHFHEESAPFNTENMNRLFNVGYQMGLKGNAWRKAAPELDQR